MDTNLPTPVSHTLDVGGVLAIGGWFLNVFPTVAVLLAIIWYGIEIYTWMEGRVERRHRMQAARNVAEAAAKAADTVAIAAAVAAEKVVQEARVAETVVTAVAADRIATAASVAADAVVVAAHEKSREPPNVGV